MAACVVDASVTLAWVFDEGGHGTALDRQIGELDLVAPWLWRLEVVNAVLVRECSGRRLAWVAEQDGIARQRLHSGTSRFPQRLERNDGVQ